MARIVKAPDERRTELIKCAQSLFYSKGYERTSISDIVNEIGVAKGLFYYYFESKSAVLSAIVERFYEDAIALMHPIVMDDTLTAIPKWNQAFAVVNAWKLERKDEMLGVLRSLFSDENILLSAKLNQKAAETIAPELAIIIQQGIDEGVFDTPFGAESAAIVLAIAQTFREKITDILLNPTQYDDPAKMMWRQMAAIQTAIERVLGAPADSLPFADFAVVQAWFDEPNIE